MRTKLKQKRQLWPEIVKPNLTRSPSLLTQAISAVIKTYGLFFFLKTGRKFTEGSYLKDMYTSLQ